MTRGIHFVHNFTSNMKTARYRISIFLQSLIYDWQMCRLTKKFCKSFHISKRDMVYKKYYESEVLLRFSFYKNKKEIHCKHLTVNIYKHTINIWMPMIIVIQKHHFEYLRLRRCTVKQFYVSERKEKEYQVDQILCTFYRDTFNICKKYNEWC